MVIVLVRSSYSRYCLLSLGAAARLCLSQWSDSTHFGQQEDRCSAFGRRLHSSHLILLLVFAGQALLHSRRLVLGPYALALACGLSVDFEDLKKSGIIGHACVLKVLMIGLVINRKIRKPTRWLFVNSQLLQSGEKHGFVRTCWRHANSCPRRILDCDFDGC